MEGEALMWPERWASRERRGGLTLQPGLVLAQPWLRDLLKSDSEISDEGEEGPESRLWSSLSLAVPSEMTAQWAFVP